MIVALTWSHGPCSYIGRGIPLMTREGRYQPRIQSPTLCLGGMVL